jgi:hypothetical protein
MEGPHADGRRLRRKRGPTGMTHSGDTPSGVSLSSIAIARQRDGIVVWRIAPASHRKMPRSAHSAARLHSASQSAIPWGPICSAASPKPPARVSPGAACRAVRVFFGVSLHNASGTFRPRIIKILAAPGDSEIPSGTMRIGPHACRRTSYGLYNRASCRMPGYTIRLPGASPAWTPTREGRCPSSGLSPKTERGGVA